MFFKIQKFLENLRADFLKLSIQVFLSHISALPNTNLYSPFSIFSSVSRLSPTATADMPMSASSWTRSSVIAFNALTMIMWQFFLPLTNSKIHGYRWKLKLLPNLVANKPNTPIFCSSAAIHFFCSSFKESILGKFPRALSFASSKLLFTHLYHATLSSRRTNWPISMTVYLMDGRTLVEQQEQWTANRRFIFLFPSSRASREILRSPLLAHRAPVMQAKIWLVNIKALKIGIP